MNRIRKSFKEEEDNSMNFLAKLSSYKESAQQQKKKTSMINHKAEWIRDMERFSKLETALTNEVGFACMTVDRSIGGERLEIIFSDEKDDDLKTYFAKNEDFLESRQNEVLELKERIRCIKAACQIRPPKSSLKPKKVGDNSADVQIKSFREFLNAQRDSFNQEIGSLSSDHSVTKLDTFRLEVEIPSTEQAVESDDNLLKNPNSSLSQGHKSKLLQLLDSEEAASLVKDEDEIVNYLRLTWGEEDVDPTKHEKRLLEQYRKALNLMNERYRLEIKVLDAEYEGKGRTEPPEFFQKSSYLEEFRHIQRCYSTKGKDREFYMERLQLHFPKQKKLVLEIMDTIVQQSDFKQQRLDALFRNYLSERTELKRKAELQVQDMLTEFINDAKRKADRLQLQVERDRIHGELEERREAFMIKKQLQLDVERQKEEEKLEEERQKLEVYQAHVKQQKIKAKQYEAERIRKDLEEKNEFEQKQIEQKREFHEQVIKNKVKVDARQDYETQKQEQKLEMKELSERERQLNQERIEKAIESYSCRPNVQQDPKRLKQPTQALLIKRTTKYDKADKIPLTQVHGFTVNQLMSDMRYKVSSALADAGLQNTQHAKDVMRYLHQK